MCIRDRIYVGAVALIANLVVAVVVTLVLRAVRTPEGVDHTRGPDYHATTVPGSTTPDVVSSV